MKHLEWHENEHKWIWRIYVNQIKTSAFIPYQEGVRPAGISDEHYRAGLHKMELEDEKAF